MKSLQEGLGLKSGRILTSNSRLARIPIIGQFLDGIKRLITRHEGRATLHTEICHEFTRDCDSLFDELGPELWPDIEEEGDTPVWLLENSKNSNGQFPARFQYSNLEDRKM